jgi:uncharacterized protein DUF6527
MKARRVVGLIDKAWGDDPSSVQKGDFEITTASNGQRFFWLFCPGKCGSVSPLALRPLKDGFSAPSWELSGTEDAPTLSPSIHHLQCWHGWLRDGILSDA